MEAIADRDLSDDSDALAHAVADALHVPRVTLQPLSSGASRAGFGVLAPTGELLAFLRLDDGQSGISGTEFDLAREARLLERVRRHGIPVPRVLATLEDPQATVMEFVPGDTAIAEDSMDAVAGRYMDWLAAIHQLPADTVEGTRFDTTAQAVAADLRWWHGLADRGGLTERPLVRLALRVLAETVPPDDAPPRVLHGDAGPGNFLVADGEITALLDWEMAHLGDPHEDLAWAWIRAVHTSFGSLADRFNEYARASGTTVDEDRLWWAVGFVLTKTVIGIGLALAGEGASRLVPLHHRLSLVYSALLASALARNAGAPFELLRQTPVERGSELSTLITHVGASVPADDRQAHHTLEYLAASARLAEWERDEDRRDVARLVGDPGVDLLQLIDRAPLEEIPPIVELLARRHDRMLYPDRHALWNIRKAQSAGLGL